MGREVCLRRGPLNINCISFGEQQQEPPEKLSRECWGISANREAPLTANPSLYLKQRETKKQNKTKNKLLIINVAKLVGSSGQWDSGRTRTVVCRRVLSIRGSETRRRQPNNVLALHRFSVSVQLSTLVLSWFCHTVLQPLSLCQTLVKMQFCCVLMRVAKR